MAVLTSTCTPVAAAPAPAARMRLLLGGAAGGAPAATARFLMPGSGAVSGRVAVVQTVVAPPGVPLSRRRCTNQSSPSECFEAFSEEIEQFRAHGAIALVDGAKMKLLGPITDTAKGCLELLTELMEANTSPLPAGTLKEVISIGKLFVEVEAQCSYGSVRFNNIVVAIDGLVRMAEIFPGETDTSKENLEKYVADGGFVVDIFRGLYTLVKGKYSSM